jgi:hypothetical protein
VNVWVLLAVPDGLVTVTFLGVRAAPDVMAKVAVSCVPVALAVMPLTVTPLPDTATVVPVAVKLVPTRVTATAVPCRPEMGEIEVNVAVGGLTTVNVSVLLVPPGAVTVTVLGVSPAVAVIVKFAVTVASFTTVTPLTVTPAPDTVTAVAPVKPVPVRVTGTTVPRAPVVGAIEVRDGPSSVNVTPPPLVPPGVVTVTVLVAGVRDAFAAIVKVAVI